MRTKILHETIPLVQSECFTMSYRQKTGFTFPLHCHEEYELNFVINASNAKRIVGDSVELIDDLDLVLVGPWIQHGWFNHLCKHKPITEITIQFHKDLFDESFLQRNQMLLIKNLLERSSRGVLFSKETVQLVKPKLENLTQKKGFESVLELMSILHILSLSNNNRLLSDYSFFPSTKIEADHGDRIKLAVEYMNEHYCKSITLHEVAKKINMAESAFSRYFKSKTGINFIDSLIHIRLGHASRLLIDTNLSVAEIAYECGFNNISNFNRIFKKKKSCTPKTFKETFAGGVRVFV